MTDVHGTLSRVERSWEQVLERTTPAVRRLRIAERDIELVVAGDELASILLPSFDGHPEAAGPPCATVGAWDAAATGVALPPPLEAGSRWLIRDQEDGRPMAGLEWPSAEIFRVGNRYVGRHLLGVARASAMFPWEAEAPLRRQLWWALGPDALMLHAAAVVGSTGSAAMLMGPPGSGKSSTALACLLAGMGYLGDDFCLVRGEPPVVHMLHAVAMVREEELPHLGDLASCEPADRQMKARCFPQQSASDRLVASAPVGAILVPEPTGEATPRLVRIRAAQALRLVAPDALWQMHFDTQRELAALRKLLTAVPAYRLLLSRDRAANPPVAEEALALSLVS